MNAAEMKELVSEEMRALIKADPMQAALELIPRLGKVTDFFGKERMPADRTTVVMLLMLAVSLLEHVEKAEAGVCPSCKRPIGERTEKNLPLCNECYEKAGKDELPPFEETEEELAAKIEALFGR